MQNVFVDDSEVIEDVDFSNTHMVLIVRDGRKFRLCSVPLPLPSGKVIKPVRSLISNLFLCLQY